MRAEKTSPRSSNRVALSRGHDQSHQIPTAAIKANENGDSMLRVVKAVIANKRLMTVAKRKTLYSLWVQPKACRLSSRSESKIG